MAETHKQGAASHAIAWRVGALVIIVIAILAMPRFGRTYEIMRGWVDQSLYMHLLDLLDQKKFSEALSINYMGPSYLAIVYIVKRLFAIDSISSLIIINRVLTVTAIILPMIIYGLARGKFWIAVKSIALCLTFVLSTPYIFLSTIPWSHYVFCAFGVAFLVNISLELTNFRFFLAGVLWGVMATIRLFEAEMIAILCFLCVLIEVWPRRAELKMKHVSKISILIIFGIIIGYFSNYIIFHRFHIYRQYNNMMSEEAFQGSVINLRDIPVKLIQFFIDPCFYSICKEVNFSKVTTFVFENDHGLQNYRLPFLLQTPFYTASIAIGIVILIMRPALIREIFTNRVLFIGTGLAMGLPVAYSSYIVGGADQLKYGFVRELFFPSACLLVVMNYLIFRGITSKRESKIICYGIPLTAIVALQIIPAIEGFPRLRSTHIASVTASQHCDNNQCALSLAYKNAKGQPLHIPFDRYAMARIKCADGNVKFAGVVDLSAWRFSRSVCDGAYEVTALSTTTGVSRLTRDRGLGGVVRGP